MALIWRYPTRTCLPVQPAVPPSWLGRGTTAPGLDHLTFFCREITLDDLVQSHCTVASSSSSGTARRGVNFRYTNSVATSLQSDFIICHGPAHRFTTLSWVNLISIQTSPS
ncbi:hypothetical protein V6Z94_003402 [Aspergillus fumigatus]